MKLPIDYILRANALLYFHCFAYLFKHSINLNFYQNPEFVFSKLIICLTDVYGEATLIRNI